MMTSADHVDGAATVELGKGTTGDAEAAVYAAPAADVASGGFDGSEASILRRARAVMHHDAASIVALAERLEPSFAQAVTLLWQCQGRVVVTGVGKSGLIGQKISATLASTGAPSYFLHAAEALHGDLGRLMADDVVIALSNSGESAELLRLLPSLKAMQLPMVAITARATSTLGRAANITLVVGEVVEACAMGLVPTTSTTAMVVLGDALATCLAQARGLDREAYARTHPGGALGRKLMRVHDVMRQGLANPVARPEMSLRRVIGIMSETPGRPGAASIADVDGRLLGFFTDGDLRRLLEQKAFSVDVCIHEVMQRRPKAVRGEHYVDQAVDVLRAHHIDQLPVVDDDNRVIGLLDVQDVLQARVS